MKKITQSILVAALLFTGASVMATVKETSAPVKAPSVRAAPDKALGQAETLLGSLVTLVKEQHLIVVKGESGVPYNFKITAATKIDVGGKKTTFDDLDAMAGASISVTYVPMRQGNIARTIKIDR